MIKTFKRTLAVLLAIVLTVGAAPLSGFFGHDLLKFVPFTNKGYAESYNGTCGENLTWTFDSSTGELKIEGTGAMYDYSPYNYPYEYTPWHYQNPYVESVVISSGVTSIGDFAFYNCANLKKLIVADTVTYIGKYAFCGCYNLNITIPDGVINIGEFAFSGCNSSKNLVIPDNVLYIDKYAFATCANITSVKLPDGIMSIGDGVFAYCYNLTDIIVSENCNNYTVDDGVLFSKDKKILIQYPGGKTQNSYVIPDGVSRIGADAFTDCDSLTSITIPDGVTGIGQGAFSECQSLSNIIIPYGVTKIEDYTFTYSTSLASITIPDSVESIGIEAFNNCESLTDVCYLGTEEQWNNILISDYNEELTGSKIKFNNIVSLSIYNPPSKTTYCVGETLDTNGLIINATYADGTVKEISSVLFECSPKILSTEGTQEIVVLYDGKTTAFNVAVENRIVELEIDTLPSKTTYCVGDTLDTSGLTLVATYADGSIERISSGFISSPVTLGNAGTQTITVSYADKTTVFDVRVEHPYGEILLESAEIDENQVANLYESGLLIISGTGELTYPFEDVPIKKVRIGNGITGIGDNVFEDCYELASISIPDSVTSIGDYAFSYCDSLKSVTIPDSVTSIGKCAFYDCENLTTIIIPDSVTKIDDSAFEDCVRLTSITIPDGVTSISNYMFAYCYSLTSITIPDNLISIGKCAFYDCEGLTTITIPDSVTKIDDCAFKNCVRLTSITIPDGVTSISNYTFADCYSLTSITIPDNLISIGECAFENCDSLTTITIPDSVTTIGEDAFYSCDSLESVTIGSGIKSIEKGAFSNCKKLTDVYYAGTEEEWNAITIGSNNTYLTNATIHYNHKINEHEHNYTSSVTTNATCTQNGVITYTCDCGDSYTEATPLTPHIPGEWQITIEPSTETAGKKIKKCTACGVTVDEEDIERLPKEPVMDNAVVKTPSTTSVSYGDAIILRVDASKIPEGGRVEWSADNGNFKYSANGDTCRIDPNKSGSTTFTATIYDAQGNAVSKDEQTMTSKAGFFDKLIAFFKKLFGLTKVIQQSINF